MESLLVEYNCIWLFIFEQAERGQSSEHVRFLSAHQTTAVRETLTLLIKNRSTCFYTETAAAFPYLLSSAQLVTLKRLKTKMLKPKKQHIKQEV